MTKLKDVVDPKLIDEVVDEIVSELKEEQGAGKRGSGIPRRDLMKLKEQLEELQKTMRIDQIESHVDVTEKFNNLNNELDQHIIRIENEVNTLKRAMVKLNSEIKRIEKTVG